MWRGSSFRIAIYSFAVLELRLVIGWTAKVLIVFRNWAAKGTVPTVVLLTSLKKARSITQSAKRDP